MGGADQGERMAAVDNAADAGLWNALNRLETSYWLDVDHKSGANANEFYEPDGVFVVGNNRFQGHEKIQAFYAWRQRRGPTTTRHLIYNLQVISANDNRARVAAMVTLYAAHGRAPVQSERPPSMIADIVSDCVRGKDDVWRYQSHVLHPIFVGSDLPLSLSIDTQILGEKTRAAAV
jgi:hypothetical protein